MLREALPEPEDSSTGTHEPVLNPVDADAVPELHPDRAGLLDEVVVEASPLRHEYEGARAGARAGFKATGCITQACGLNSGIAAWNQALTGDGLQRNSGDRCAYWRAAERMSERDLWTIFFWTHQRSSGGPGGSYATGRSRRSGGYHRCARPYIGCVCRS